MLLFFLTTQLCEMRLTFALLFVETSQLFTLRVFVGHGFLKLRLCLLEQGHVGILGTLLDHFVGDV